MAKAKNDQPDDLLIPAGVEESEFPLTIEEWCTQTSREDRRVEMLGAFCAIERAAGRTKDLPSAYAARLVDFATAPVSEG